MNRYLRLLALLVLSGPLRASDGLAFTCPSQTMPGQDLAVRVARVPELDPVTSLPRGGAGGEPLGDIRVAVFRCRPRGAMFKPVFRLRPRGGPGDLRLPGSEFFQTTDQTTTFQHDASLNLIWELGIGAADTASDTRKPGTLPKRIAFPAGSRVASFTFPGDSTTALRIPKQPIGTYVLEFQHGDGRAYLPWRVSSLGIEVERLGDHLTFQVLHARDASPVRKGELMVRWQGSDPQRIRLGADGTAEVDLGIGHRFEDGLVTAEGEALPFSLGLPNQAAPERPGQAAPEPVRRRAFLVTDRPVYRPGDEVFVKVVMDDRGFDPSRDLVSPFCSLDLTGQGRSQEAWRHPYGSRTLTPAERASLGLVLILAGQGTNRTIQGAASLVDAAPLTLAGGVRLPEDLQPGSYHLSLLQFDRTWAWTGTALTVQDGAPSSLAVRFLPDPEPVSPLMRSFAVQVSDGSGGSIKGLMGQWTLYRQLPRPASCWFDQGQALARVAAGSFTQSSPSGTYRFDAPAVSSDPAARYRLLVKVTDGSGRRETVTRSLGRSEVPLHLVLDRPFAEPQEPVHVGIEQDGPMGPVSLRVSRAQPGAGPFWHALDDLKAGTLVTTLGAEGGTLRLPAGTYLVEANATTDAGAPIQARQLLVVAGAGTSLPATDRLRTAAYTQDGEMRIMAMLPQSGLTLQWHLEGAAPDVRGRQAVPGTWTLLRIPIQHLHHPKARLILQTAGGGRWFEAQIPLEPAIADTQLDVRIHPQQRGDTLRLDLEVLDSDRRPVAADLSVAVSDEAGFRDDPAGPADPSRWLHPEPLETVAHEATLQHEVGDSLAVDAPRPFVPYRQPLPDFPEEDAGLIPDFQAIQAPHGPAAWIPMVKLEGRGHVDLGLPGTPGAYRVTVLAAAEGQRTGIGRAEFRVDPSAQDPASLSPVLPAPQLPQPVLDVELHRAARQGDVPRAALLLKRGARVDAETPDGTTPLFGCAQTVTGVRIATLLLEAGADPDHAARDGRTPLQAATLAGNGELAALLLGRALRTRMSDAEFAAQMKSLAANPRLQAAPGLSALLAAGAQVDGRDDLGATPLMWASRAGHLEAMAVLLQAGASAHAVDNQGQTALMYACEGVRDAAVACLLKAGADARIRDHVGRSALMNLGGFRWELGADGMPHSTTAPAEDYERILSLLLDAGFDPKGRDQAGNTELHSAFLRVPKAGCAFFQRLRDAGVDPNAVNNRGETLLNGWPFGDPPEALLQLLGRWHLDPDHRNAQQLPPLHAILWGRQPLTAKTLHAFLEYLKPDLHLKGPNGAEPVANAARNSSPEIVKVLLDAGAHPSGRDDDGDTPLAEAMLAGRAESMGPLLAAGARPVDAFRGDWESLAKDVRDGHARERFAELAAKDEATMDGSGPGAVWTQGALTAAVLQGDVAFLQAVADAGIDLSVPWKEGLAPLDALKAFLAPNAQGQAAPSVPVALEPVQAFARAWAARQETAWQVRILPANARVRVGEPVMFDGALRDAGGGRTEILWSLETPTPAASIDRHGLFTASQAGRYRVVATDPRDPSRPAMAEVRVAGSIQETRRHNARASHGGLTMVPVGDGRILSIGGWSGTEAMDLAMLWEGGPSPRTTEPGRLLEARIGPLAAGLEGGKVLVCNGWREEKGAPVLLRSAEIFNAGDGKSFRVKPAKGGKESTRFAHCGGVICRLPNGTVLLAGGDDGGDHDSGAELFDPKSGTFALLDPSPFPRGASVVALASGRVLLFGGRYQGGKAKGVSAQVLAYDPSARSFSHAGTLRTARSDQAAVLLPDGKVLVVGGFIRGKDADSMDTTADCEVFDPRTGTSEAVAAISEPRALLAAAVMPIGQVMILGGLTGSRDSSLMATTIETFDPWRRTWSIYDRPSYGVFRPALFPMPDGSMFVGGSHVAFDPAKRAEDGVLPLKLICE